jgi:hypothetical protein
VGLLVTVPEGGQGIFDIKFLSTVDGTTVKLNEHGAQAFPFNHPAVFTEDGTIPLAVPGETVALPLRLGIAKDAPAHNADGMLRIVVVDPTLPAMVEIKGSPPKTAFAPSPVKLRVTRWWGPLSFFLQGAQEHGLYGREQQIRLSGPGAKAVALGPEPSDSFLNSDHSGDIELSTTFPPDQPESQGMAHAEVHVDRAPRTGNYSGSVTFFPVSNEPLKLDVEADVQDAFIWPLALLIVMSFLGGYAVNRWTLHRQQSIVRATIRELVDSYLADKANTPEMYELNGSLIPDGVLYPTRNSCKRSPDTYSGVTQLYCRSYLSTSPEEMTALEDDVRALSDRVSRWRRIRAALTSLQAAIAASDLPETAPVMRDSHFLMDLAGVEPTDEDASRAVISKLRGQSLVIPLYTKLWHKFGALPDDKKQELCDYGPSTVYVPADGRDEAATTLLLVSLRRALRVVAQPQLPPPPPSSVLAIPEMALDTMLGTIGSARYIITPEDRGRTPAIVLPRQIEPDRRTPGEILRGLRRWDLVIAISTAVAVAVVYMLTVYSKHTFGSWDDYLGLAAAGFLGQVVVGGIAMNWALFPALRSYRLASSPPTQ